MFRQMLMPPHCVVHSPQSHTVTSQKGKPMSTLHATTVAGTEIQLDAAAVTAFKARRHGALLCPEDPSYEHARKRLSGVPTLRTLAIVEATSGSRGWCRPHTTRHAEAAWRMACAGVPPVVLVHPREGRAAETGRCS